MTAPKDVNKHNEWKRKISEANKGRVFLQEVHDLWSKQRTGEGNPNFGKTHSIETRAKE